MQLNQKPAYIQVLETLLGFFDVYFSFWHSWYLGEVNIS